MKKQGKKHAAGKAKLKHASPDSPLYSRILHRWKSLSPRSRLTGSALALLLAMAVSFAWLSKEMPRDAGIDTHPGVDTTAMAPDSGTPLTGVPVAWPARNDRRIIRSIDLTPEMPTKRDELTAGVIPLDPSRTGIRYHFRWHVNQQTVQEGPDNRLDLGPFQVRDAVSVVVTPYAGELSGFSVESHVVAIHGAIPTLTLEPVRQPVRPGEPIRLQLAGGHPDEIPFLYRLEQPYVPGMTIDKSSGEILFTPHASQTGTIVFGAAVEDSEGTRVSKIFEVDLRLE